MSNTLITSDTHAYHKSILKFCPDTREGRDAEHMTELMTDRWNEQVKPNDTVYHLGDVSWARPDKTEQWLSQLNGKIHLIRGNHDYNRDVAKWGHMFESVQHYKKLKLNKHKIIMFHYPIVEWDSCNHGSIHLYGHVHGRAVPEMSGKSMDVGIDTRPDYQLYHIDEIFEIMKHKQVRRHH